MHVLSNPGFQTRHVRRLAKPSTQHLPQVAPSLQQAPETFALDPNLFGPIMVPTLVAWLSAHKPDQLPLKQMKVFDFLINSMLTNSTPGSCRRGSIVLLCLDGSIFPIVICGGSIFHPEVKIYYYYIRGSNEETDPRMKSMC